MAHRIKVFSQPHQNKSGGDSKSKKDWFFRDRHRSGVYLSPAFGTEKEALRAVDDYRSVLVLTHQRNHPNDIRGMKLSILTKGKP